MRIERGFESLFARKPTPSERRHLRLDAGEIVMVVTRVSFHADGRVLDAVDAVHDSRRYIYHAVLQRTRGGAAYGLANAVGGRER